MEIPGSSLRYVYNITLTYTYLKFQYIIILRELNDTLL
jgi:hypothetical protein